MAGTEKINPCARVPHDYERCEQVATAIDVYCTLWDGDCTDPDVIALKKAPSAGDVVEEFILDQKIPGIENGRDLDALVKGIKAGPNPQPLCSGVEDTLACMEVLRAISQWCSEHPGECTAEEVQWKTPPREGSALERYLLEKNIPGVENRAALVPVYREMRAARVKHGARNLHLLPPSLREQVRTLCGSGSNAAEQAEARDMLTKPKVFTAEQARAVREAVAAVLEFASPSDEAQLAQMRAVVAALERYEPATPTPLARVQQGAITWLTQKNESAELVKRAKAILQMAEVAQWPNIREQLQRALNESGSRKLTALQVSTLTELLGAK